MSCCGYAVPTFPTGKTIIDQLKAEQKLYRRNQSSAQSSCRRKNFTTSAQEIGICTSKMQPVFEGSASARFSTLIVPPCASTTSLQIARPSPVPPFSFQMALARKGSKMRSTYSGAMPGPLSETEKGNSLHTLIDLNDNRTTCTAELDCI